MSGWADEHRRIAGAFTTTVEGTAPELWDKAAPVDGWVARDVVRHLVEWFPAFLREAAGIDLPTGPSVDDDPAGAWRTQTDAVQTLLDDLARRAEQGGRYAPSFAGFQNRLTHSIKNVAMNNTGKVRAIGMDRNSKNRRTSATTIVCRRSNRSANAPASGPRMALGSNRTTSTPPKA